MRGRRAELNTFEGQVDHFLSKVRVNGGCWEWIGYRNPQGYGIHKFFGKAWSTHRLSYHLFISPFDKLLDVCHSCDNTSCVNPFHLFLGTAYDNIHDMIKKGRQSSVVGEKNPRATLTETKVLQLRRCYKEGQSLKEISQRFDVNYYTLNNIVNGWSWKHLKEIE